MIDPESGLRSVIVEASKDRQAAGENVIDLAEYFETKDGKEAVKYYQLKHSTRRIKAPFTFNELKHTISEFAGRFRSEESHNQNDVPKRLVTFSIVTNRQVSLSLKSDLSAIAEKRSVPIKFRNELEASTKLTGSRLANFCRALIIVDTEGDYKKQRWNLHTELSTYLAGQATHLDTTNLVDLIADRALPESEDGKTNGEITPEDLLQRLGVNSQRDLFPAPAAFDPVPFPIRREQHDELLRHVLESPTPTIVHAAGGVGKSVVARLLAESLPNGSLALIYDCFGAGKYRSPSEHRHRTRDALLQMANELASRGLCRPLLLASSLTADELFRAFLARLTEAVACLQAVSSGASLVILVDAADNAEMAAIEYGDRCFAGDLLKADLPSACYLAMLCRTERINLLKPTSNIRRFELRPFSENESLAHLRIRFPEATGHDGKELYRLSGGNPRVQALALDLNRNSIEATLASLGPELTTVDEQIAGQLQAAVNRVKDAYGLSFPKHVDALCQGLANLPPLIPIPVLAQAAGVTSTDVISFVSDLGRPLWHSDGAVQFRDEPTETWFLQNFSADRAQISQYVTTLEPLAKDFTYVAKALPQLLLKSGDDEKLVELALSDKYLPEANPIDQRDVRVYRLQFAFKAALKLNRLADSARLAFRAGEETAGTRRQIDLLGDNVDLITSLQEMGRIQELAYRRVLEGGWQGSDNIYSASLLSGVPEFIGEARTFLRSAQRWLKIYFDDRKREPNKHLSSGGIKDTDILEMAWARYHIFGANDLVNWLSSWRLHETTLRCTSLFISRLVDAGRFDEISTLASTAQDRPYIVLAIVDELNRVAKLPRKKCLLSTLRFFSNRRKRPKKERRSRDRSVMEIYIVSFLEACTAHRYARKAILEVLKYYTPDTVGPGHDSDHSEGGRHLFLRGIALRGILSNQSRPEIESLFSKPKKRGPQPKPHQNTTNLQQMLGALLPWHWTRTNLLVYGREANPIDLDAIKRESKNARLSRYRTFDRLPTETSSIRFEVLAWKLDTTGYEIEQFNREVVARAHEKFWLSERLSALRIAVRTTHLRALCFPLELRCRQDLIREGTESPEHLAAQLMLLARAVFPRSRADARSYFSDSIEAVSKFGDEMVERWEAVIAMGRRASQAKFPEESLVYRFLRCAELIGETVAREKYWDRDDVFRVAAELNCSTAFAASSRWRDRGVGYFTHQVEALAIAAVERGEITSSVGFCLGRLLEGNTSNLAATCLKHETQTIARKRIFECALSDLSLENAEKADFEKLRAAAIDQDISRLDHLLSSAPKSRYGTDAYASRVTASKARHKKTKTAIQESFLTGRNVLNPSDLHDAFAAFDNSETPRDRDHFLTDLIEHVPAGKESEFLDVLIGEETLDYLDVGRVLSLVRLRWIEKAAVKRNWPRFLKMIGRRFARELSNYYRWKYLDETSGFTVDEIAWLRCGMMESLTESPELVDSSTFFGFAAKIANELKPEEARDVFAYALGRFELHMASDYADGPWADWLVAPTESTRAVAGLIWAALGSPEIATRWRAAHCVRRLAEFGCEKEIDSLLDWMKAGEAGSFASKKLPFYSLHAQLYLLLALSRVTLDQPVTLVRHANFFADIATSGFPHALLQRYASDIARRIEHAQPKTLTSETLSLLRQIDESPFPELRVNERIPTESPWHHADEIDTSLTYNFPMDFVEYWLEPLGRIFGVSKKQIKELVTDVCINQLHAPNGDRYHPEPRQSLFNRLDLGYSPDRSQYPKIDSNNFYISYHAMLSVAARLFHRMPIQRRISSVWDDESDPWRSWLEGHSWTCSDGTWLSDRRDPLPSNRRDWTNQLPGHNFTSSIGPEDFFDVIFRQSLLPGSLCVEGQWADCDNSNRTENISIASALVDSTTSEALASAMQCSESRFDFQLPAYQSSNVDYGSPPFDLVGWIGRASADRTILNGFDPYANEIEYPPLEIGAEFAALLEVSSDQQKREWRKVSNSKLVAACDIWSASRKNSDSFSHRHGRRLCVSIDVLRELCAKTKKHLIFSVAIIRPKDPRFKSKDSISEPTHAPFKIFLLSQNGTLREATKSYRPR